MSHTEAILIRTPNTILIVFTTAYAVLILLGVSFLQPLKARRRFIKMTAESAKYTTSSIKPSSFQLTLFILYNLTINEQYGT